MGRAVALCIQPDLREIVHLYIRLSAYLYMYSTDSQQFLKTLLETRYMCELNLTTDEVRFFMMSKYKGKLSSQSLRYFLIYFQLQ